MLNDERLYEIIISSVESFLNEESSVSYDVLSMTRYYEGLIFKKLNLNDVFNLSKRIISTHDENGDVYVKKIAYSVISIDVDYRSCEAFNSLNKIIVKVFNFKNRDELQEHFEDCEIGGTSGVLKGTITINGFSINGKVNTPSIKSTLQHEFEHMLQYEYGMDISSNQRLKIANDNLSSDVSSCGNIIARLYYFFSKQEIDAKIQELYFDLRKQQIKTPNELKRCFAIKEKNKYLELLANLLNDFTDEEINSELSKYKENKKSFLQYIDRQSYYFDRKSWKVMMQYFDEIENVRTKKRIK